MFSRVPPTESTSDVIGRPSSCGKYRVIECLSSTQGFNGFSQPPGMVPSRSADIPSTFSTVLQSDSRTNSQNAFWIYPKKPANPRKRRVPINSEGEPDYPAIMIHARGCKLDEKCNFPICLEMKLSLLHYHNVLDKCKGDTCQEISCKAVRAVGRPKTLAKGMPVNEKIKKAILLSDLLEKQRERKKEGGIQKPVPVYKNIEAGNGNFLTSQTVRRPSPSDKTADNLQDLPGEKEAIEFYCGAYVNVFLKIARAGKG